MTAPRVARWAPRRASLSVAVLPLAVVTSCSLGGPGPASSPASPPGAPPVADAAPSATTRSIGSLVVVGRIVTMDDPPVAEAVLVEGGTVVAVGTREDVFAVAGDQAQIVELGHNVAYPGFIDAHAHWIGDREYYGVSSPADAMDLAVRRGWTTISEQWVNPERLDELASLAADDALRLRVDAYLALNFDTEFFGDWYLGREPGIGDDRLRVQGLKIHLDDGWGKVVNWEPGELTETVARANEAGWQVSVHSMSSAAQELVLDAFEAAIGPRGPNPLHHRIEHAVQVTDEELARMVALNLALVIHPDGEPDWIMDGRFLAEFDRDNPPSEIEAQVGRWRDFVDAGLHVAFATDAPWTFPDFEPGDRLVELTDGMGRAVDQIAAGMDGRQRMNREMPSWLLDQLLTADQGLRAVTSDAAWALGDEERRGRLAPGMLGDVTILSGDVTAAAPDEIRQLSVVATIVGGVVEYCSEPQVCGR